MAIPIVLTIAGYFIQRQLSDEGLKKDYVGIAAGILKDDPENQEPELRTWAVKVLEQNSPVPFSSKAKASLLAGVPVVVAGPAWVGPPTECMLPPSKRTVYADLLKLERESARLDQHQLLLRMQSFIETVIKQEATALEASNRLQCVQRWANSMEQGDIDYRKAIGAPSSNSIVDQFMKERAASSPLSGTSPNAPQPNAAPASAVAR